MGPPPTSETSSSTRSIKATQLPIGSQLKFPIRDPRGVLLLAAGQKVTESFLKNLQQRGILSVNVDMADAARLCAAEPQGVATAGLADRGGVVCPASNAMSDWLDQEVDEEHLELPDQGTAFAADLPPSSPAPYDEALKDHLMERQELAARKLRDVFRSLLSGKDFEPQALSALADEALEDLRRDADLFAAIGVNPLGEDYPTKHGLHVSMLAVSIGVRLGLDRTTLHELAVGCLIHDAGMLRVAIQIPDTRVVLGPEAFRTVAEHPIVMFDRMPDQDALPRRPAFIAYQMHERVNGSGYPRRRRGGQIHRLSQIAAVADAYVGLVSPRPHRQALLPYCAMEKMLIGVRDGRFDAEIVRALLRTLSLFPLGSYVQLSDGRVARVLRSSPEAYEKPTVQAWDVAQLQEPGEIIDLSQTNLSVLGPITNLGAPESPLLDRAKEIRLAPESPVPMEDSRETVASPTIFPCSIPPSPEELRAAGISGRISDISQSGLTFIADAPVVREFAMLRLPAPHNMLVLCRIVNRDRVDRLFRYKMVFLRRLEPAA